MNTHTKKKDTQKTNHDLYFLLLKCLTTEKMIAFVELGSSLNGILSIEREFNSTLFTCFKYLFGSTDHSIFLKKRFNNLIHFKSCN